MDNTVTNAAQLMEEIKKALAFFELAEGQLHLIDIAAADGLVMFKYGSRAIALDTQKH